MNAEHFERLTAYAMLRSEVEGRAMTVVLHTAGAMAAAIRKDYPEIARCALLGAKECARRDTWLKRLLLAKMKAEGWNR